MIKPQEIRIGSLLDVDGNIIKVGKIDENSISWNIAKDTAKFKIWNPFLPISDKRINPIPLTEEILLEFGFYFEDGFYCLRINNTAFMTIILLGSYANYELSNFRQKIVFSRGEFSGVHQLQNLYFDLKNEELTFKKD